ncbi:caspase family protein [Streptomyces sp. SID13726]|uniref:caspase family protein n=1 Tax=Streptomyces sp. SID13726 TaxID=2706058 RepID=UPI0013B67E16|nr:caspase family protein [Streptomyces sp. SID13726]NEA99638.1 caspase family protein [Streptomyces sp. SID13726]
MGSIYAFMAGINDYPAHVATPLTGCVNDIRAARRLLVERTGGAVEVRTALDGEATAAALEDGIRDFLGSAGSGDTALFWFSGHGTRRPAGGGDLLVEATGWNQALVCADGPLPDKRVGALLDAVAARGVQVVAVLDCCYSGGATREDGPVPADLTARFAPPRPEWRTVTADRDAVPDQEAGRHLLLAASRLDQLSFEGYFDGVRHGVFTHALLSAVRAAGPDATYRQLLAAADARVRRSGGRQQPVLFPPSPGLADLPFLAGAVAGVASGYLLRRGPDGWEVDCGSGHGLRDGAGADGTEFGVVGEGPAAGAVVRARVVRADRCLVDPVRWTPDPELAYPVALTALASAPATVSVEGPDGRLRAALASYGPGGGPAPLVRLVDAPEEQGDPHFRVVVADGAARVLGRDGTEFVAPLRFGEGGSVVPRAADADARRVVDCLTHLARWHRLRDLTARPSVFDSQVRVEIVPWEAPDGPALVPDGRGEIVCEYRPDATGPREPWVQIRLHNRSQRPLWCVLLDLTDSWAADPALFQGHFIGPGRTGYALDGEPVRLFLPESRPAVPGAEVRDWLKLIVAEGELNTAPFRMRAWDAERTPGSRGDGDEVSGVLRFDAPVRPAPGPREAGRVPQGAAGRWATRTVTLRTVVPAGGY